MSVYEPIVILAILKNSTAVLPKDKKEFEAKWKAAVSETS